MGHAEHFLSRVSRLDSDQAELALSLYRDPELVRRAVQAATVPDGAPRVALALEESAAPAHAIVDRDGSFVTCLAAGMQVHDAHVVPRSLLDSLCKGVFELRERMKHARAVGGERPVARIIRRLLESGSRFTREELSAAVALAPLWQAVMPSLIGDISRQLRLCQEDVFAAKGGEKFARSTAGSELLRLNWRAAWALSHLSVILAAGHVDRVRRLEEATVLEAMPYFLWDAGDAGMFLRSTWAVAQFGGLIIDKLERRWREAQSFPELQLAPLALVTLARATPGFGESVERALQKLPDTRGRPPEWAEASREIGEPWRIAVRRALREPQEMDAQFLALARDIVFTGAPGRWASREDVPEEIARASMTSLEGGPTESAINLTVLMRSPPWLGRARAEDLFLPAAEMDAIERPWNEERAVALWRRLLEGKSERRPVEREAPKPGRNEPCPCGSGRKYKRCCES